MLPRCIRRASHALLFLGVYQTSELHAPEAWPMVSGESKSNESLQEAQDLTAVVNVNAAVDLPAGLPHVLLSVDTGMPLFFGDVEAASFPSGLWSSHHGATDSLAAEELWNIGTHAGRSLKADETVFPSVPEDPARPGFADTSFLRKPGVVTHIAQQINQSINLYGSSNYQLIMALSARKWPPFMMNPEATNSPLPQNVEAAADLVTEFVAAISEQSGAYLPAFFEAINEPDTSTFSGNETLVKLYQEAVRQQMMRRFAGRQILVGGPAFAGSNLAHNRYRDLPALVYSPEQGFISMHLFDGFWSTSASNGSQPYAIRRNAGGHIAAVFDLVEASTLSQFGRVIPLLPSEHGLATDGTAAKNNLVPAVLLGEPLRALQVDSHWSQIMSLLDRSEHILHTSAFLLSSGDSARRNPSVCMGVVRNRTAVTTTAFIYKLLQTLANSTRVVSSVTDLSTRSNASIATRSQYVIVHAYRSLQDFHGYEYQVNIALTNLENSPVLLTLSLDSGCTVARVRYAARAFINDDGLQTASLNSPLQFSQSNNTVRLERRESSVVRITCASEHYVPVQSPTVARRLRYYSSTFGVPLPQNRTIAFKVDTPSIPSDCVRVVLRVGLSTDFSTNATLPFDPPGANPPMITLNGRQTTGAPTQLWSDPKMFPKGWTNVWRAFEYEILPTTISYLADTQDVQVTVDDDNVPTGGTSVSAVVLDVYVHERSASTSSTDNKLDIKSGAPTGSM